MPQPSCVGVSQRIAAVSDVPNANSFRVQAVPAPENGFRRKDAAWNDAPSMLRSHGTEDATMKDKANRTPNRLARLAQVASLALTIVTVSFAWAADTMRPNGGRAAPVSIVDLDISTIDGQLIAQERVGSMARTLCDRIIDPLDLGRHEHYVHCVATATDQAMRQILAAGFARAAQVPPSLDAPANTSVQVEGQTPRAKVSLTDLDLSTAEGVRAAHERLHDVARRLCAQIAEESEISHRPNFVKCVGDTMATARVDVGSSSRTQLVGRNR